MVASKYAKRDMMESEFTQRASQITPHGLGLSVDVYSPDVILLAQRLHNEGLQPGYMEIFKRRPPPCSGCDDGFQRSS